MLLVRCLAETAAKMSDQQLDCALRCAERCALETTRTRREMALLRARCFRLELERRALRDSEVLAVPSAVEARV